VIVYPFTTSSSIDREASSRLATIIAQQMANTGRVIVLPPPPGTERKDYLTAARANDADYYIAGYMTALGDGVSLVEQVVGTGSGIVIYSRSAQLSTYADAAGQGDDLATFLSNHANRSLADVGTPPPAPSPTAEPSGGASTSLSNLFHRKKPAGAATAKPAAAPASASAATRSEPAATRPQTVAAATNAGGAFAVTAVDGPADAASRDGAIARVLRDVRGERAATAASACTGHTPRAVLSGILLVKDAGTGKAATFELDAKDCAGKQLWRESATRDASTAQLAVERAVDAAVTAYLNPPRRARARL
jgi:hypothetical protein